MPYQYRMDARAEEGAAGVLSCRDHQELLLIRANLEPQTRPGEPFKGEISEMLTEIRELLSEPDMTDAQGRVVLSSDWDGKNRADRCGDIDLETLKIIGPEQQLFEQFADIKKESGHNCMSTQGLLRALKVSQ